MRASDFGFDMSILEDISDENKVIIDLAEIKINFDKRYLGLLSDLNDYIDNYDTMSLQTREFIKNLLKEKYIGYRNDAIRLLKNNQISPEGDKDLQEIFDKENPRFQKINDLVNKSKIMK